MLVFRGVFLNPQASTGAMLSDEHYEKQGGGLGGGFKHFLFSPLVGEDSHFDILTNIFQRG